MSIKQSASAALIVAGLLAMAGCTGIPQGLEPVGGFDVNRYLGTWYEIARLDHSFERGLSRVTAEYTLRSDGGIDVLNRGYDREKGAWKEAEGKAYFLGARDEGRLKVSFFGPFYGGYNVIALDREEYSWSVVCGPEKKYFWILARQPHMDRNRLDELISFADEKGFDTDGLILVDHGAGPDE
jgi:apolipoprotein D and lipocalin family protein